MIGGIAVIGIVLVVLLWQTGIGPLVRALFNRVAFMIPKAKRQEATLLRGALDGEENKIREAIAAKRVADPTFDAAWQAETARKSQANSTVSERP